MLHYLGDGITFPIANAGDIKASGIAFPVVGFIVLVLRGLTHWFGETRPGAADLFGVISWILLAAMGGLFVWSAEHGAFGWPTPDGPLVHYEMLIQQDEYITQFLMALALGTTKLSILFFFRRLFVAQKRNFWDWLTRGLIALVTLWTLAMFLNNIFYCGTDPSAFWALYRIQVEKCEPVVGVVFDKVWGITDLILDVFCLALPFPIIWRLKLQRRYKISITGVFLVGLMTIAASIARLVIWIQILNTASDPTEDINLAIALAMQWAMIETGIGFIASQLPALGTYFTRKTHQRIAGSVRSFIMLVSFNRSQSDSLHEQSMPRSQASREEDSLPGNDKDIEAESQDSEWRIRKTQVTQINESREV